MKKPGRYKTSGLAEDSYESGSRGRVLQNKLGITGMRAMDEIEAQEGSIKAGYIHDPLQLTLPSH